MLTFKFEYPVKPIEEYKIEYGLKSKSRPYSFKYPVGIDNGGMYRFSYDRRDQIYIEDGEINFVLWPRDININNDPEPFIKILHEIEGNKEFDLRKPIDKEVIEENTNNELNIIFQEFYKENLFGLNKSTIKNLEIEGEITLDKTIEKILDIYQDFLLEKTMLKGLIIEKIQNLIISLDKPIERLYIGNNTIALDKATNTIEKEIERRLFKGNKFNLEKDVFLAKLEDTFIELFYEVEKRQLELNLFKLLDIFADLKLTSDFIKNIDIEKTDNILTKEEKAEVLIKSAILLSKLENEISIHEEEGPYFKVLSEIFKHEEPLNNILYLSAIYDMVKEKNFIQVKLVEKDLAKFKSKMLDKNFEKDLEIENIFKLLISNTKHDLYEDAKEELLKNETIHKTGIEECFKQMEKVYEIIIDIEKRMKQLDKEYIVDLYEEEDIYQLTKKLAIHDLITEEEFVQFEKSPIGQILLEQVVALNKAVEMREIEIDESIPMIKGYKEIMINEDIEAAKEAIEIDINKEEEFWKVVYKIELEDDEEKIEFNKRFWFLRATDPFDWKILPYSDYPYKEKPIIFGEELIPDNWQLDMPWVPRLQEGIYEHPIPFGEDLAREEMELSIEIMIDIINIMILIWSRMFYNFSGYTGSQAVIRFTKILYDWLMLETSMEEMEKKGSKEHYFRC